MVMSVAQVLMVMYTFSCLALMARQQRYNCVKLEIPGTDLRKERHINLQLILLTLVRYCMYNYVKGVLGADEKFNLDHSSASG